jgi:hypothetical protein
MYERETFSDSDLRLVLKESGTVSSHRAFLFPCIVGIIANKCD